MVCGAGALKIVLMIISVFFFFRATDQAVRLFHPRLLVTLLEHGIWQQGSIPPMIGNPAVLSETPILPS
jgi:hypothetical protein